MHCEEMLERDKREHRSKRMTERRRRLKERGIGRSNN